MNLKTICEIDSTGPVRAISEGRIPAERIRRARVEAMKPKKRQRFTFRRVSIEDARAIVATARRRGWFLKSGGVSE